MELRVSCLHASQGICRHAKLPQLPAEPSRCGPCPHYRGPMRGLGDAVAAVTKAVGVAPCGGCLKRRQALNEIAPNPLKPS